MYISVQYFKCIFYNPSLKIRDSRSCFYRWSVFGTVNIKLRVTLGVSKKGSGFVFGCSSLRLFGEKKTLETIKQTGEKKMFH